MPVTSAPPAARGTRAPTSWTPAWPQRAVGVVVLLIGLAVSDAVAGFGVLILIVAAGLIAYGTGRVGPAVQARTSPSCCGCSCVVIALCAGGSAALFALAANPLLALLSLPFTVAAAWLGEGVRQLLSL